MPSPSRIIAGFVLALLIGSGPAALADTSCTESCPWARPVAAPPKRPKFSLSVALRAFSFSKPSTKVQADPSAPAGSDPRDSARIDAALASHLSPPDLQADRRGLPQLFSWMRGWRLEKDRGLFRPFRSRSRIAFAYSDVFETGGDPDKGGHGLGFVLRHDFGSKPHGDVY